MKKIILTISCFLFCATMLFAMHKKKNKTPKSNTNITAVSMHRTACFGKCPDYIVEIKNDGIITYKGIRFTQYEGVYTKQFGKTDVTNLLKEFESYRVDTCKDMYEMLAADLPGIEYIITYKDKTKHIMNADFGPVFLRMLSKNVDNFSHVDDTWKKISDKATQ